MRIKDLATKGLLLDILPSSQLLLEWQRPYKSEEEQYIDARKALYKKLKASNHGYFKAVALAINYSIGEVSLVKKVGVFPALRRGTKGLLLEDRACELLPLKWQELFKKHSKENLTKLVLFDGFIFGIPLSYLKSKPGVLPKQAPPLK